MKEYIRIDDFDKSDNEGAEVKNEEADSDLARRAPAEQVEKE